MRKGTPMTPDSSSSPIDEQLPSGEREELKSWRLTLVIFSLCSGLMLSMMDNSIVATSIYTIGLEFNSLSTATWIILAYTLAYLGFAVIFARLSDFLGRKIAVMGAFVFFIAFSLGCGFAKNLSQLIVFRTFQGLGGSGLYSLAMILLFEVSNSKKMVPIISGLVGATIAVAGVIGPVVGGVLTSYATWRWVFWLNGPCGAVPLVLFFIAWPKDFRNQERDHRPFSEFDYVGSVLLLAASVMVVLGLEEAGSGDYGWESSVVIGVLTAGCVSWVALFAWEYFISSNDRKNESIAAIYPIRVFKNRVMTAGIISTMLTGFSFFISIFNLSMRFQRVNLASPSTAGIRLLPLLCATAVGSFVGGAAQSKGNRTSHTLTAGSCFVLIGAGLLSTLSGSIETQSKIYGFEVIIGFGVGLTFSSISMMTSIQSSREDHAVAQGIVSQVRVLGGSIGVATGNIIFLRQARRDLFNILTPQQIGEIQSSPSVVQELSQSQSNAVRLAYSDSFNQTLRICTYLAAVSVIASAFTYQRNPPQIRVR